MTAQRKQILYRAVPVVTSYRLMSPDKIPEVSSGGAYRIIHESELPLLKEIFGATITGYYSVGHKDSKYYRVTLSKALTTEARNLLIRCTGLTSAKAGLYSNTIEINYRHHRYTLALSLLGLHDFYSKVRGITIDVDAETYNKYRNSGAVLVDFTGVACSYTNHEGSNEWPLKLYFQPEISQERLLEYETRQSQIMKQRTIQAREETDQQSEKAYQEQYTSLQSANQARQEEMTALKDNYSSQIFYSKIVRYGLLAGMAVAAVVLVVLIVIAFRGDRGGKKTKKK